MNWLWRIERLVDQKPEWHTRLMNGIDYGLVEHLKLIDDLCREFYAPTEGVAIAFAVSHYQKRAQDELHDEYKFNLKGDN